MSFLYFLHRTINLLSHLDKQNHMMYYGAINKLIVGPGRGTAHALTGFRGCQEIDPLFIFWSLWEKTGWLDVAR
jgi:hypothetical protein